MRDGLYTSIYGKSYLGLSHQTSTALSAVVMSSTESDIIITTRFTMPISQQEQHQVHVSQVTDGKGRSDFVLDLLPECQYQK